MTNRDSSRNAERLLAGNSMGKSIFPTFDVNVPMPGIPPCRVPTTSPCNNHPRVRRPPSQLRPRNDGRTAEEALHASISRYGEPNFPTFRVNVPAPTKSAVSSPPKAQAPTAKPKGDG